MKKRGLLLALRSAAIVGGVAVGLVGSAGAPALADTTGGDGAPVVVIGPLSEPGQPSYATCPDGTRLIGGGYEAVPVTVDDPQTSPPLIADMVDVNAPSYLQPNSWVTKMLNGQSRSYALCEKR
ncbi:MULTISPECIES: hypothetical protein [unclassified Streptomyces]|uniref:hypothetical protein n=1 Tax=unclassified Streptomyces TaxID=2593676 RepID=UPI0019045457|nr:hypothetical protein [Streptomyces sp. HSG2]